MGFKSISGFARIKKAFGYSVDGLLFAWSSEAAFRQEIKLFLGMLLACFAVRLESYQYLVLLSAMLFVLILELINSAIESLADRVSSDFDLHIKAAKDLGSASVLLGLAWLFVVWFMWVGCPLGSRVWFLLST